MFEPNFSREDQGKLVAMMNSQDSTVYAQICRRIKGEPRGRWLEVRGKNITDAKEQDRRIVGYIRDIHETKMRELEQEKKAALRPGYFILPFRSGDRAGHTVEGKYAIRYADPCGYLSVYSYQP